MTSINQRLSKNIKINSSEKTKHLCLWWGLNPGPLANGTSALRSGPKGILNSNIVIVVLNVLIYKSQKTTIHLLGGSTLQTIYLRNLILESLLYHLSSNFEWMYCKHNVLNISYIFSFLHCQANTPPISISPIVALRAISLIGEISFRQLCYFAR